MVAVIGTVRFLSLYERRSDADTVDVIPTSSASIKLWMSVAETVDVVQIAAAVRSRQPIVEESGFEVSVRSPILVASVPQHSARRNCLTAHAVVQWTANVRSIPRRIACGNLSMNVLRG